MLLSLPIGFRLGTLLLGTIALGAAEARAWQAAETDPQDRAVEAIGRLNEAVDDRDAAAIQQALRVFDEVYADVEPKTIKKIGRAVTRMFKEYEPRIEIDLPPIGPLPGDEPLPVNMDAVREVIDCYTLAVGVMHDKPEGAKLLLPLLKLKHVKEMPRITALVVEGLGYRRDAGLTKTLAAFLDNEAVEVASAAAAALSELQDHPQPDRLVAVKALIGAFKDAEIAVAKEQRRTKEDDPHPADDHLSLIEVPFGEALKSLTRQRFDTPAEWRAWFAEHGKESDW